MYPYKTVERALTRLHGDSPAAAVRVSNRLRHFSRFGFAPQKPGKGRHIVYSFEDVAKWAYALRILEFGADPTEGYAVVQKTWEDVWPAFEAEDLGQNQIFIASPGGISHPNSWAAFDGTILSSDSPAFLAVATSVNFFGRMMLNLSAISRHLWAALEEAEAGVLRDITDEVARIEAGEATSEDAGPDIPAFIEQANKSDAFGVRPKPRTPRVAGPTAS